MTSPLDKPNKSAMKSEKNFLMKKKINTRIWSDVKDLSETLRIPFTFEPGAKSDECRFQHMQYKAGQYIHRNGQNFESLYIINSGFVKTVYLDDLLNDQILSFPMKGDALGIDAIHTKRYVSDAIALTTCDVIILPYRTLQIISKQYINFDHLLFLMMSRDLARKQNHLCLIGSSSSEARVAQFLVRLGQQYAELGYSANSFELRMARHEIGSYLGLTLETVSRTLTIFQERGLITVARRSITINAQQALRTLKKLYPINSRRHRPFSPQQSPISLNMPTVPTLPAIHPLPTAYPVEVRAV